MPLLGGPGRSSGLFAARGANGWDRARNPRDSNISGATGPPRAVTALLVLRHGAALLLLPAAPDAAITSPNARPVGDDAPYQWHLPRGFPMPAVPPDNPMSSAKVALGRRLFFETRLSVTGQYSCASCHVPARAYTDGRAIARGATGQPLVNSAMSLVNVAYNISFGWSKPELQSLEAQMLEPLLNEHPVELGLAGRQASVCNLLAADPEYPAAFARAFPEPNASARADVPVDLGASPITFANIVKAIAAFERTLISRDTPFDHYIFGGDHEAISPQAKRGMQLFYSARAGCGSCHSGFNFNGNWRDSRGDTGKPAFANNGVGDQLMRVPTLRNIAVTAPYMHDGRLVTLDAVLDHYARVGGLPESDAKLRTFNLSADERADVIAFLQTLTDGEFSGR
jgi:cytochrome c peroxidase